MFDAFQGQFQMRGARFKVPRAELEAVLPDELLLNTGRKNARMVFVVGEHLLGLAHGVTTRVWREAMLLASNIRLAADPDAGSFNFVLRAWVDHLGPAVMGSFQGFPREVAEFRSNRGCMEICQSGGTELITIRSERIGAKQPAQVFTRLQKKAWRLPTLTGSGTHYYRALLNIEPGEMVQPCQLDIELSIPQMDFLPNTLCVDPISHEKLGGLETTLKYSFGLVPKLPVRL
jgi:hypothetical protein